MTSPNAARDLLIFCASLSLSPCTLVFAKRSLPAKSTRQSLLLVHSPFTRFLARTMMHCILKQSYKVRWYKKQSVHKEKKVNKIRDQPVRAAAVLINIV